MKVKKNILFVFMVFTLGGLLATAGFSGFQWEDHGGAPWSQPPNGWAWDGFQWYDHGGAPWSQPPNGWAWDGFRWEDNPSPAQGAPWSHPPNGWG